MIRFSDISLLDALQHGDQRFKTIKNFENKGLVNQDKYSITFAINYNGNDFIIKVMREFGSERTEKIYATAECIERMQLPFISKTKLLKDELELITSNNHVYTLNVILTEDDAISMFAYIQDGDSKDVINSFVELLSTIIGKGYIFDRFDPSSFIYDPKRGVYISTANDFIFDGNVSCDINATKGFRNFLTMTLLQLIADSYNISRGVEDIEIEYIEHNEKFDLRRLDYFLGGNYCKDIISLISSIKEHCDFNCGELLNSLYMMNPSSTIDAINKFVKIDFKDDKSYDFIGQFSEDRIMIRHKKSNKVGYVDFDWNVVIDFIYDDANDFSEGVSVCINDEMYGAIDRFGNTIVPFIYSYLEWNSKNNMFYWRIKDGDIKSTPRNNFIK